MIFPSRHVCRFFWTLGNYSEIIKNYESCNIYRELFITGNRRLDLDAIYFTALLHTGREEDILNHIKTIKKLKDSNYLPHYMELNKFVVDNANLNPSNSMMKSVEALKAIGRCQEIDSFWKDCCTSKEICIVGNGPCSDPNGKSIDAADIVLRFNNFQINGYEKYIGTKTDVWCRICDIRPKIEFTKLYDEIPINILTDNPLNIPVGDKFFEDIQNQNKTFYYIPQKEINTIGKELNAIPSSGARIIMSLANNKRINNISARIYGFSFLIESCNKNNFEHYFESKPNSKEKTHNINNEVKMLRNAIDRI